MCQVPCVRHRDIRGNPGNERTSALVLEDGGFVDDLGSASWRIAFEGMRGVPPLAEFTIAYEHRAPVSSLSTPRAGALLHRLVEGTLRVNASGFPVDLVFTAHEEIAVLGDDVWTVRYSYDDGSFLKEVWTYEKDWSIDTPIPNHPRLDRSEPSGLFLFLPSALHCMGSLSRRDAKEAVAAACDDSDPAFANPGLLGVALAPWLESGEQDLDALLFTPLGPDVFPGLRGSVGIATGASGAARRGTAAAGVGIPGRWREGTIDRLADLRRYFEPVHVRATRETTIEVGARTMAALKLDVNGTLRAVYADRNGRVLRADIDPHPITGRPRWIRLLYPSEY